MPRAQLGEHRRRDAQQESPQCGRIRRGAQTREVLEYAVLPEQLGRLDAFQFEDHRIEHGEPRFADAVAVVALLHPDGLSKGTLETNPTEKPLDEVRPAVVGQRVGAEVEKQISGSLDHCVQPYPRGRVRRNPRTSRLAGMRAT